MNNTAAESRIRDANIAEESSNLTKYNILTQSGIAALAQANQTTARFSRCSGNRFRRVSHIVGVWSRARPDTDSFCALLPSGEGGSDLA